MLSHVSAAAHWELRASAATLIDVRAPMSRHGGPGIRLHRSRSSLKEAIGRHDPKWTRTDLEAWFLAIVRDAGMPEPMVNSFLAAPPTTRAWISTSAGRAID